MSLDSALAAIKTANVALNALIGTRFNPDYTEQLTDLPAVCYQEISRVRPYAMGGPPTVVSVRVQMDGYAATVAGRIALADALRHCFNRYRGIVGSDRIYDIRLDGQFSTVEQLDTQAQSRRVSMDFIVDITET